VVHAARNISWNLFYSARNKFVAEKYKSFWVGGGAAAADADKTNNLLQRDSKKKLLCKLCIKLQPAERVKLFLKPH